MYQYQIIREDARLEFSRKVDVAAGNGYRMVDFKYHEYVVNVKGEGQTVMQSYVGIMEKLPEGLQ